MVKVGISKLESRLGASFSDAAVIVLEFEIVIEEKAVHHEQVVGFVTRGNLGSSPVETFFAVERGGRDEEHENERCAQHDGREPFQSRRAIHAESLPAGRSRGTTSSQTTHRWL